MTKMNIRRRMMLIVLSISIVTLVILSGVSFYGMIGSKNMAIEAGDEIGKQSSENSSKILQEQMKNELIKLSLDKAEDINHRMRDLAKDVEMVAAEMNEINANPNRFINQTVDELSQLEPGRINFYIQYIPNFNRSVYEQEIGLTANIKDFMIRTTESNSMIGTMVVASIDGFTLSAENNIDAEEPINMPITYNAPASDWYKSAVNEQKLIFTNARRFIYAKTLGLFCAVPYYSVNGELEGVACAQASLSRINRLLQEINLYNSGYTFVVDNRGYVILSSDSNTYSEDNPSDLNIDLTSDLRLSKNTALAEIAKSMTAGEKGVTEAMINGKDYFVAYAPIEMTNWSFAAVIEREEIIAPVVKNNEIIENIAKENTQDLNSHMIRTMSFMAIFILLLLAVVTYIGRRLSNHFVDPIHALSDGVREIASGNLDKKLNIKTGDEIEHLAVTFNAMTDELKHYMNNLTKVTAEKERIATELDVAKNIQTSMLPNVFPPFPERKEFDIYATMNAAKEVGGDFYDFYLLDENHLVVTIADVSGKGIPASLFMVISKTILKNFAMTMSNPDDFSAVMACSNNQLCQNNDAMMFVTVFMGMLDIKTGEFIYVNGGHNPPVIYHKNNNTVEYLKMKKNFVLGGMEDIDFTQQSLKLDKGDIIFMYTDGVTEALNIKEELYSEDRLLDCLKRADKSVDLKELLKFVRADVNKHVGEAEQSDDITMLALKVN